MVKPWQWRIKRTESLNETTVVKSSFFVSVVSDGGIEVSMVAFQAVDPGSIPGHRKLLSKRYFVI